MAGLRRVARWGALVVAAMSVGAVASFLLLTRTQMGHAMVLAEVLRRVESGLHGGLRVGALRSNRGLQRSATFVDVELRAEDGSTVFRADSVSAAYSVRDLVNGTWVFRDVELWRPVVTLARSEPGGAFTAESILSRSDSAGTGGPRRIAFENVGVHDGLVEVHDPLSEGEEPSRRMRTERPLGGDGLVRRLTFAEVGGRFRRVTVVDPEVEGLRVDVTNLALRGEVFDEPILLRQYIGSISFADDRLLFRADRARLPGTQMSGLATIDWLESDEPSITMEFTAPRLTLSDLSWALPVELPDASGAMGFGLVWNDEGLRIRLSDTRLRFADGGISGNAVLAWTPGVEDPELTGAEVRLEGLASTVAEQILPVQLPFGGALEGTLSLEGSITRPRVKGTLVHRRADLRPSRVEVDGGLLLGDDPGAEGMVLTFDPLSLGVVDAYVSGLDVSRVLRGRLSVDGTVSNGLQVSLDASYPSPEGEPTAVSLSGRISRVAEEVFLALEGSADPIWFPGLVREGSPFARLGRATGTLDVRGPLTDLAFRVDLETPGGRLELSTRLDARRPLEGYRLSAVAERFDPTVLLPELPAGTELTGEAEIVGGGGLDEGRLDATLRLFASKIAKLAVDSARVVGSVEEGLIRVEGIEALIGRTAVSGSGTLGASHEAPSGELALDFETYDLIGLRPLWLGENVIAADTLSPLHREILALDGIDADTLPLSRDIDAGGTVVGTLTLAGSLDSLSVSGSFAADNARYGTSVIEHAEVHFDATGLPSIHPRIEALIDTGPVRILERVFDSASVRLDYRDPRGGMDVFLVRSTEEDYRARVNFEWGAEQRILNLDELLLRFSDSRWNLGGPATIAWDRDGLTFDNLRIIRPGTDGLRFTAEGRLPFRGSASLDVAVDQLDLARVARTLQLRERLEGVVSLELEMGGRASAPTIEGELRARDFRFREYQMDSLEAELSYEDRRLSGDAQLWKDDREVLNVRGALPADLAFGSVPSRFPDEAVDLHVAVDSLPLAFLMAPIESYSDVVGTLSGSVALGGTLQHLAPDGRLVATGAGAFIEDIGVRHRDLDAVLELRPDGSVGVTASVQARGRADVTGSIHLSPLSDAGLDLTVRLRRFLAIDRSDVRALLSGEFRVDGSYQSPVVSGNLVVAEGELFVEEFMRTTDIVDIADSTLLNVVDTTIADLRPLIAGANPFLRNIRMENMRLRFESNSWVRSENMNIELGGELDVLYDRGLQEIALFGMLNALRGRYTAFGRGFNVEQGTMRFIGLPGINPDLNIVATNRIRTLERDALDITATVFGTLGAPRVTLTSNQPGLSDDDLISYMYFGRPTYALTAGQTQALGAAEALLVGSGVTLGLQSFSTALGAAASELGFAYLSITQQDLNAIQNDQSFGSTLVLETGRYLADDFFLTLLLRPLSAQGAGSQFGGLRLEWAASNAYTLEAFVEERFFRGRVLGFGELGVEDELGFGLFFFREWGY